VEYFAQHAGWPIAIMSVLMIYGAVIDGWKRKVPNNITYPMIVLGWAWWLMESVRWGQWGLFGTSFLATFAAGLPLLLLWRIGFMGAGDVKLYAGFGAWMAPVGNFGYEHLAWAFAYSVVLGGIMGAAMMAMAGKPLVNLENAKEALNDLAVGGGADAIRAKALVRKQRVQLLPYGVPLTIGSLAYVAILFSSWRAAGL
jgi:prepilin peptidase CpaA